MLAPKFAGIGKNGGFYGRKQEVLFFEAEGGLFRAGYHCFTRKSERRDIIQQYPDEDVPEIVAVQRIFESKRAFVADNGDDRHADKA